MMRSGAAVVAFAVTVGMVFAGGSDALATPAGSDAPSGVVSLDGDVTGTQLAFHDPPPRRYYPTYPRRPARRVYVEPTYVPQPRRPAERVRRPRFSVGVGLMGNSIADDDETQLTDGLDTGAAFELDLGWRMGSHIGLSLNWMIAFHEAPNDFVSDGALYSAFSLNLKWFLTGFTRVQPYLQFGFGAYMLARDNFDVDTIVGPGFQMGGGVDIYLTAGISIGGKLLYRGAYMEQTDSTFFATEEAFVSAVSYGADVKFHF